MVMDRKPPPFANIVFSLRVRRGSVVRWHSFQNTKSRPPYHTWAGQTTIESLTVGQLLVLRKLALLKLTAIMERYCPTHRTGWNWELPKFMRKTKIFDPTGTQPPVEGSLVAVGERYTFTRNAYGNGS